MIPVGFGLARFRFSVAGDVEPMVCTTGVKYDAQTPETWPNLLDVALVSTGLVAVAEMDVNYTYLGVSMTYQGATGPEEFESSNPSLVGTFNTAPLPNNSAILVRKRTALGGRKNRGRFYWPMYRLPETDVSPIGNISTGQVTALQTDFSAFLAKIGTDDGALYVLHDDAGVTAPTAVIALDVQSKIATQRRRLR